MHKRLIRLLPILLIALLLAVVFLVFVPSPALAYDPWYNGSWGYRQELSINHSLIDTSLTNFPVLVTLDAGNFDFSHANTTGEDVRFVLLDGRTVLNYERERHDQGSELAEYWVNVTSVSSSANTTFYLYYGNTAASDSENITGVWDANYKGVWHMTDATTSTVLDSTSNNNDGTKESANDPQEVSGQIYKGQDNEASDDDYILIGDKSSLEFTAEDGFTLEAWAKCESTDADRPILVKHNDVTDQNEYWWGVYAGTFGIIISNDGATWWGGSHAHTWGRTSGSISSGVWTYIVTTWDGANWRNYQDGIPADPNPSDAWSGGIFQGSAALYIGTREQFGVRFDGIEDEVRASNTVREAAYIKANYHTQTDNLLTYGSEEEVLEVSSAPTNFTIVQTGDNDISITWTKDSEAEYTIICYDVDRYPTNITDGWEVYNGTGSTLTDSGLSLTSHEYCYKAWSWNVLGYSADYAEGIIGEVSFMMSLIFIGLAVSMMVLGFWQRKTFLFILAGLAWVGLAMYGLWIQDTSAGDVLWILGWFGLGAAIIMFIVAIQLKEKVELVEKLPPSEAYDKELHTIRQGIRDRKVARRVRRY